MSMSRSGQVKLLGALLLLGSCAQPQLGFEQQEELVPDKKHADLSTGHADLAHAPFRDWARFPPIVEVDTTADIYAMSDVHGDYDRTVALLVKEHILEAAPAQPAQAKWAAGSSVLVVVGDNTDKWNQGLKVLALWQALGDAAAASGGQVIVTLGNHEAEFLASPDDSKVSDFAAELSAAGVSPADVAAGRNPLGQYLRSLPVAARVRDWFFSHSGNSAGKSLAQLREDIETGMDAQGFSAPVLLGDDSILEAKLDPTPWWELSGDPAKNLARYASALGVSHLVMGHQPAKYTFADGKTRSKGTIFPRYKTLFLIDTGMSQGVDYSKGGLLQIQKSGTATTATALYADGTRTQVL